MNQLTTTNQTQDISSELFNSFITWLDRGPATTRSYIINLRQFAAWLQYKGITKPDRQDIIFYRQWLSSEHDAIQLDNETGWRYRTDENGQPLKVTCKPGTVAQYLRSVKQLFSWTAASGCYPNIAENIRAPQLAHGIHKKDALTPAEVRITEQNIKNRHSARIREATTEPKDTSGRIQRSTEQAKRIYAIYLLAVNAGLRTVELSRANIQDLIIRRRQAWLYIHGKGHTEPDQKKPIAPPVYDALQDYLNSRTDEPTGTSPLFVSTSNRSKGKRIAPTTISTMLKRELKAAGFNSDRITAHSLRHTTGTAVQNLTGNIYQTQKYMRHQNPATTEIYLHNDTEKQEAEIAKQLYDFYQTAKTN